MTMTMGGVRAQAVMSNKHEKKKKKKQGQVENNVGGHSANIRTAKPCYGAKHACGESGGRSTWGSEKMTLERKVEKRGKKKSEVLDRTEGEGSGGVFSWGHRTSIRDFMVCPK